MDSGKEKLKTTKLVVLVRASSDRKAFELLKAHAEGFMDPARADLVKKGTKKGQFRKKLA